MVRPDKPHPLPLGAAALLRTRRRGRGQTDPALLKDAELSERITLLRSPPLLPGSTDRRARLAFIGEKLCPDSLPAAARQRPRNRGLGFLGRDLNCASTAAMSASLHAALHTKTSEPRVLCTACAPDESATSTQRIDIALVTLSEVRYLHGTASCIRPGLFSPGSKSQEPGFNNCGASDDRARAHSDETKSWVAWPPSPGWNYSTPKPTRDTNRHTAPTSG